jgi:hypothetical protein
MRFYWGKPLPFMHIFSQDLLANLGGKHIFSVQSAKLWVGIDKNIGIKGRENYC